MARSGNKRASKGRASGVQAAAAATESATPARRSTRHGKEASPEYVEVSDSEIDVDDDDDEGEDGREKGAGGIVIDEEYEQKHPNRRQLPPRQARQSVGSPLTSKKAVKPQPNGNAHAAKAGRGKEEDKEENVFLFVPNLIGYSRIVLAALSLYFMKGNPKNCTVLYCISCLLDAFDGMAARALGQSTKFGAVLDMVTDRCTTSCLLCFLTAAYPEHAIVFQGLITLDFSSHYIHMYSSLLTGAASHKSVTREASRWLWFYYNDSRILFLICAGNELFFVCLYLMAFYTRPLDIDPSLVLLPLGAEGSKAFLLHAAEHPFSYHAAFVRIVQNLTWPQVLGALTLPICAVKQLINAIQFWKAAQVLAKHDLDSRKLAQKNAGSVKAKAK